MELSGLILLLHMKLLYFTIISILFLTYSCSTKPDSRTGLLWKITSKEGKIGYIYGTMHLFPRQAYQIKKKVFSTLKACKILAFERDLSNVEERKVFREGTKPSSMIREYQVIVDNYGSSELVHMEAELLKFANSFDIKFAGLESSGEALKVLSQVKEQDNKYTDKYLLERYKMSMNAYIQERIDYFDKYLSKKYNANTIELIVYTRNQNWLDDIDSLINKEKTFFAVGMGHLGGAKGLLKLLETRGYRLERIIL